MRHTRRLEKSSSSDICLDGKVRPRAYSRTRMAMRLKIAFRKASRIKRMESYKLVIFSNKNTS